MNPGKSFEELYTELQNQTGDDSSDQLTIFKRHINDTQSIVLANHSWKFLEATADITTVLNTGRYEIPNNIGKLRTVEVLDASGDVDQTPEVVEDPDFWSRLQRTKAGSSDITQYVYMEGNDLLTWPNFSTAGRTIRVRGRKNVIALTRADYTTGTITTLAAAGTVVTGSSTSWNGRKPVGEQWFRLDQTTGDYRWYKIESIDSDTQITLDKGYLGSAISAGTATYRIGEFSVIPPEFHNILFYRPMALYYMKMEDPVMAKMYWNLYDGGYELGQVKRPLGMLGQLIKHQAGALDAKYFPPQGMGGAPLSPEFLAKDTQSTLN